MEQIKISELEKQFGKDCTDMIINSMCRHCREYCECLINGYSWLFSSYKVIETEDPKDSYIIIK